MDKATNSLSVLSTQGYKLGDLIGITVVDLRWWKRFWHWVTLRPTPTRQELMRCVAVHSDTTLEVKLLDPESFRDRADEWLHGLENRFKDYCTQDIPEPAGGPVVHDLPPFPESNLDAMERRLNAWFDSAPDTRGMLETSALMKDLADMALGMEWRKT